ncbi:hypothetical protein HPB48_006078 [Haemaphysalis longicornis]|uniref:Uncharacterized protein n=1 Tax=Haemaphysalis longicornis TaxID=44386 RepID=A0A9J6G9N5_HAELO|nr:hypothetical protein HPB48_006078 [Haemaphysalis longicornis]
MLCLCSAWGEGLFLMLETALIAALVLRYRGQTGRVLGFTASYACLLAVLVAEVVPVSTLWSAQLLSLPVIICGKRLLRRPGGGRGCSWAGDELPRITNRLTCGIGSAGARPWRVTATAVASAVARSDTAAATDAAGSEFARGARADCPLVPLPQWSVRPCKFAAVDEARSGLSEGGR